MCKGRLLSTTAHHIKQARYIVKIAAGRIKATGRGFAKFLVKFIESGSVARKPWSGKVETELTVQQNGADHATERNGPWNETDHPVLHRF